MAKAVRKKKRAARPVQKEAPARARRRPGRDPESEDEGPDIGTYVSWGMRVAVVVALAIAAWIIVPPWLQAQKAQPIWNQAVDAANNREYDRAISLLQKAKELAPDWQTLQDEYPGEIAKYYVGKAFEHAKVKEDAQAIAAFEKAFENDPKAGVPNGSYYAAAECYQRQGKLNTALEMAKKEVEYNGRDAKAARNLVKFLIRKITGAGAGES